MLQDIRLAFRLSRRTPVPTGIALVSIALSVGATAVVFGRGTPGPHDSHALRSRDRRPRLHY